MIRNLHRCFGSLTAIFIVSCAARVPGEDSPGMVPCRGERASLAIVTGPIDPKPGSRTDQAFCIAFSEYVVWLAEPVEPSLAPCPNSGKARRVSATFRVERTIAGELEEGTTVSALVLLTHLEDEARPRMRMTGAPLDNGPSDGAPHLVCLETASTPASGPVYLMTSAWRSMEETKRNRPPCWSG